MPLYSPRLVFMLKAHQTREGRIMKQLIAAVGLTFFTATFAATGSAGDAAIESEPGYVDFGALTAAYGEPRVMINIGGSLLQLARAMEHDDPATDKALENLESVRIQVYNTLGNTADAEARMSDVRARLAPQQWEQIVRVRDTQEAVDIYVKHGEERIHGLVLMAVNGEEAVFINVIGDIDPAELQNIARHVDVDVDVDVDL
jgi:hypothetical protein